MDDKYFIEITGLLVLLYYLKTLFIPKLGINVMWLAKWSAICAAILLAIDEFVLWYHLGRAADYKKPVVSSIAGGIFLALGLWYYMFGAG